MKARIAIPLMCWKRPEVLSEVLGNLEEFSAIAKENYGYEITVLFSIAKEDPFYLHIIELFESYQGCKGLYLRNMNLPLGGRMNVLMYMVMVGGYDYAMNLGSDDLVHYKLLELYQSKINKREKLFGVDRVFFFSDKDSESYEYKSYNGQFLIGAGRMIHKSVIDLCFKEFGYMYKDNLNKGLDSSSAKTMARLRTKQKIVRMPKPYIIDIKTEVNITSMNKISSCKLSKKLERDVMEEFYKTS